jgi:hypothetical protein
MEMTNNKIRNHIDSAKPIDLVITPALASLRSTYFKSHD